MSKMKRSAVVSLTLISVAALAACEEQVTTYNYPTVDACVAAKVFTPEECKRDYEAAVKQNEAVAPKFKTQSDCEAEFGANQCQQSSSTNNSSGGNSGFFMPFMMGYLMGNNGSHVPAQPLYRTNNGGYFTSGGTRIDSIGTGGKTSVRPSTVSTPRPSTTTLGRGGFGSSRGGGFAS